MITDYVGAVGRIGLDAAAQLDGRAWAAQPKVDGCYGRITTDRTGRVVTVLTRSGRPLRAGLEGLATGLPGAVLHAEVEAHTEAGLRAAASAGFARAHLFDVTALAGQSIAHVPYGERYAQLHRHHALAELERRDPWTEDERGDTHGLDGRYCRPVPVDYRRFPIVPQVRGATAIRELWRSYVERGGGEGIVVVALGAKAGARNAKRKIKPVDTLDCRVIATDARTAVLAYGGNRFTVGARADLELRIGELVEIAHSGWYEAGATPRFARLVRRRPDLGPGPVH